ncbi:MAG: DUF349 domain-containing protein [Microscillaceae bacterium]|jgi:hypothetical protein|nr:DUF349 domain-containing protein [Microscillaceae bacterium]
MIDRDEPVLNPTSSENLLQETVTAPAAEVSEEATVESSTEISPTEIVESSSVAVENSESTAPTTAEELVSTDVEPTESVVVEATEEAVVEVTEEAVVEATENVVEATDNQPVVEVYAPTEVHVDVELEAASEATQTPENQGLGEDVAPIEAEDEPEDEVEDYSHYNKEQFLNLLKELSNHTEKDFKKINRTLKEIKPLFDELVAEEKNKAYADYEATGGEKDDFDFKEDKNIKQFYQLYNQLQKQRHSQIAKIEEEKEKNLARKNELLERMRALTENEESQASIEDLKKLQNEWKSIGSVAQQYNKPLWASYNALIDLFYNKRSIYFELKELDRRKNLATKLTLCERAEKLADSPSIQKSIKELNELHEEFKHVGPVPKEEQEALWQRFKLASDKVYEKKRDFLKNREEEQKKNLEAKMALVESIKPFMDFHTDKIAEWNEKTKELLAIQKQWDAIRFIPKESIKETSRAFWLAFKGFFNNKNAFIRTLDEEREANLKAKTELCEEAEALASGTLDPRKVADKLKNLQHKWKEIGSVPAKFRDSIYERFKKACDSFFEKRREDYNSQEKAYEDNLQKKLDLCKQIETAKLEDTQIAQATLNSFMQNWKDIGFVPKKDKAFIQQKFEKALNTFVENLTLSRDEKDKLQLGVEVDLFRESPQAQKKVQQKESILRRKIQKLESDIETLKNNMGFFAKSKEASKLKENIEKQIAESMEHLQSLKKQLKLFQNL